jgi:hypothetical protein
MFLEKFVENIFLAQNTFLVTTPSFSPDLNSTAFWKDIKDAMGFLLII